jgi:hypothetical protein
MPHPLIKFWFTRINKIELCVNITELYNNLEVEVCGQEG